MQLASRLRRFGLGLFTSEVSFDEDDELMKAILHPDAHEEGGLACNDKQLLAEMRECIMQWIKSMGRQILKGNLNLVNTSFPVQMFEPRSYLQKLADIWAYPDYINAAAAQADPLERMKLLVTWMVAGLHHSVEAWRKPFNPILGETWQATMPGGLCLFMEQVSHHPPVSAYQLDGPDATWRLHGWSQPAVVPVVKFYGIKTVATGARQIDFADGSSVCMTMPNFAIKGVVYANKPHAEVLGVARLLDEQHHLEAVISFGPVPGTRQRMLARADAVCGEIYQLPKSAHLQAAVQNAQLSGGALRRSGTSATPLDELNDNSDLLPPPSEGASSSQEPDSDDEAIFADFEASHLGAAGGAAAGGGSRGGAGGSSSAGGGQGAAAGSSSSSSGGGGSSSKASKLASVLKGRNSKKQSSNQLPPLQQHHSSPHHQPPQHDDPEQAADRQQAAAAAGSSRVSAPSGGMHPPHGHNNNNSSGSAGANGAGGRSVYMQRSRSVSFRSVSAPGHRQESSDGGGVGVSAGVPGVAVARIQGCWLSHINIDNQRYWTLAEAKPQHWEVLQSPLPSDLRYRQDLAALAAGDLDKAQHYKEVLERQQRSDRKLREAAGVFEH